MEMRFRALATGVLSYVPGASRFHETFEPPSPLRSYGIWLKHLAVAAAHGMRGIPRIVAEIGPGMSLGAGFAALIGGVEVYYALDVLPLAMSEAAAQTFDLLVQLFRGREPLPNREGWPPLAPYLDAAGFPSAILTEDRLRAALAPERLSRIREGCLTASRAGMAGGTCLRYLAPWSLSRVEDRGRIDFLFSHTVLEYVPDLAEAGASTATLVRSGGFVSHQTSYDSHEITTQWNGHWACPSWQWRLARGRRKVFISRAPHSAHRECLLRNGFEIVADLTHKDASGVRRGELAKEWQAMSEEDLTTKGALVVARRTPLPSPAPDAARV
jgi:hypothetical protein